MTDVVVIGAGPAGCAAAAILVDEGLDVVVLERSTFPRFVIGESLLPRCMDRLDEAGLLEAAGSCGFIKKTGAVFLRGDERSAFDFGEQYTDGWGWTWQVPRAEFDDALAKAVVAKGVDVRFATTVADVEVGDAPAVVLDTGERLACRFVVDASGYGRVLPRLLKWDMPSEQLPRETLFAHVRGDRRPEGDEGGRIWVCMGEGDTWLWVIPFADGRTSVGVVARPDWLARLPEDREARLRAVIASEPNAAARLEGVALDFAPMRIAGYSTSVKALHGPGFCLVGNATEFLDPVFSSGVCLALESGVRAARLAARQLRGEAVDWEAEYAEPLLGGIDVFRTFVDAWYDGSLPAIFFTPDPNPVIKRQMCSVLAGYVWDRSNPFVRAHRRKVDQVARLVARERPAALPG